MKTKLQAIAINEFQARFGRTPRGMVGEGADKNIIMICDNLTTFYFIFSGFSVVDIQID